MLAERGSQMLAEIRVDRLQRLGQVAEEADFGEEGAAIAAGRSGSFDVGEGHGVARMRDDFGRRAVAEVAQADEEAEGEAECEQRLRGHLGEVPARAAGADGDRLLRFGFGHARRCTIGKICHEKARRTTEIGNGFPITLIFVLLCAFSWPVSGHSPDVLYPSPDVEFLIEQHAG